MRSPLEREVIDPEYRGNLFKFVKDLTYYLEREGMIDFGSFHKKVLETVLTHKNAVIMLTRGHLKTHMLSICYPIWRLIREEKYQICLVSATLDQSMRNLNKIQDILETTPALKYLVPEDRFETWNKSNLITSNKNELFIWAFSGKRGIHPNEIIYDDILMDEGLKPSDVDDIFWKVFHPMGLQKNCKHIVIGTPVYNEEEDLLFKLKRLSERDEEWGSLYLPGEITDERGNRKPLWSERYTAKELDNLKENMGLYKYNREILLNPMAEGSGFFPTDMVLNCTDDDYRFTYNTEGEVVIGADFAMSDSPSGDYTVFTVVDSIKGVKKRQLRFGKEIVEVEVKDPIIIRHIERFKSSTGQISSLLRLWDIFKPTKIITDASTFGKRFSQELAEKGVVVSEQKFDPASRNTLLVNLRRLIETEDVRTKPPRLIIPTSEKDFTFGRTKILLNELSGFQETKTSNQTKTIASNLKHDDTVFSLALAVRDFGVRRPVLDQIVYPINGFDIFRGNF
ncbi:MAG: hypothetical protein ACTSPI_12015 [Candidatus Heimdallarchaeaceae archaeon]